MIALPVDTARLQRKRKTQENLERRLDKEMWTAGIRYSWRKMERCKSKRQS